MNDNHLQARRTAQQIEKVHRHVRRLRQRGRLRQADAEVRSFQCGNVVVVPSGLWRQWQELHDAVGCLAVT